MNSVISETAKPITIPPEYVQYAEKHNLYNLTHRLLQSIILDRPSDPITYLIELLNSYVEYVPSIFLFGPISSGKRTLADLLSAKLNCSVISKEDLFQKYQQSQPPSPKELALRLKERLKRTDCVKNGYIVIGFPETERQAKALGWEGVFPEYAIFLEAPDQVLIERTLAKRIDPVTGKQYHLVMSPPPDVTVQQRLEPLADNTPEIITKNLQDYTQEAIRLKQFYSTILKTFDVDRHMTDIYAHILDYVNQPRRNVGLRTPRVLLLGLVGSGRKTQASRLAEKYGLVVVNCGDLLKQLMARCEPLGKEVASYVAREVPVPDAIVMNALKQRLMQDDCSTYGWILIGYPRTRSQAELLDDSNLSPNRVFMLHIPQACAAERITGRRVDPVTGIRYHTEYQPDPSYISGRALQNPDDEQCAINSKLARFAAHREELIEYYSSKLVHVEASQSAHNVFEQIEAGLVNPLPRKQNI